MVYDELHVKYFFECALSRFDLSNSKKKISKLVKKIKKNGYSDEIAYEAILQLFISVMFFSWTLASVKDRTSTFIISFHFQLLLSPFSFSRVATRW